MRWISLLYGRSGLSLAGSGGVYASDDALKMILSGADVVNLTSALLQHGPSRLSEILAGMEEWMAAKGYGSLSQFKGLLSQQPWIDTSALTREGYLMLLDNYTPHSDAA
jgi:dihydroorotate dehydrogenase (fumarate)